MSAIANTPENKNFLSPLNFRFFIKRAPHVNFFIQKVNIPDMTLRAPIYPNPMVKIPIPGDHIDYSDLSITFKVDEDLQNYLEVHNWIKALGKPIDFEGYKELQNKGITTGEGIYSEVSLMILSSTKMANYEIIFSDAHPTSLSGMVVNTTDSDVNYVEATAVFKYAYYEIFNI